MAMKDRNGREIHTGDIVKITNAYFKQDNGTYLVIHSAGDAGWAGNGHSLTRIKQNGVLSTTKYRFGFWPLQTFIDSVNMREKADSWNKEHATIEIQPMLRNMEGAKAFFRGELDDAMKTRKWKIWEGLNTAYEEDIIADRTDVLKRLEMAH